MGYIGKRSGNYRVRYRDPLRRQRSETFARKADAERYLREIQEFLSLSRRLSPLTQDAYRRDIDKYIVPRLGAYRIGRLPADEIESWLNDEVAAGLAASSVHRHYRTRAACSKWRSRRNAFSPTPATASSRHGYPTGRWSSSPGRRRWPWPKPTASGTGR